MLGLPLGYFVLKNMIFDKFLVISNKISRFCIYEYENSNTNLLGLKENMHEILRR